MTNKVDGITLLQLIRDGKIKENTLIEVSGGVRTHYPYVKFGENKRLYWESDHYPINQVVLTDDLLEYTFEIIEETKKPKEIDEWGKKPFEDLDKDNLSLEKLQIYLRICIRNQQEIIKAVNYLLKKEDNK